MWLACIQHLLAPIQRESDWAELMPLHSILATQCLIGQPSACTLFVCACARQNQPSCCIRQEHRNACLALNSLTSVAKQHSPSDCVTPLGHGMEVCHQTVLCRWQQHAGHRHQGPFPTCSTPAEEAEEGQESAAAG